MMKRSSSRDWNPSKESGTGREHPRYLARLARCFADANHAGDKETEIIAAPKRENLWDKFTY
jgi:hypothetical protein